MQSAAGKAVVGGEAEGKSRTGTGVSVSCLRMSTLRVLNATEFAMRYTPRLSSRIFPRASLEWPGSPPGGAAIAVMANAHRACLCLTV